MEQVKGWLIANADAIAAFIVVWFVGRWFSGLVPLGAGAAAYLLVQGFVPATRAGVGPSPFPR